MRLLEGVAVALCQQEPALLVGETGTGKTTLVQRLADQVMQDSLPECDDSCHMVQRCAVWAVAAPGHQTMQCRLTGLVNHVTWKQCVSSM